MTTLLQTKLHIGGLGNVIIMLIIIKTSEHCYTYVLYCPACVCWICISIIPLCCLAGCVGCLCWRCAFPAHSWFCVPCLSLCALLLLDWNTRFFFFAVFSSDLTIHFLSPDWEPGCTRCTAGGTLHVWCRHGAAGEWCMWSANTLGALLPVDVLWWQAAAEQADRGHARKGPTPRPLWRSGTNNHNHLPKIHGNVMQKIL